MPKPCSLGLRERVVDAVKSGASRREAAEWFEVSPSSAIKWMQRRRATGSIAPKPSGGSISPLEQHADFLLSLIAGRPDLTLDQIVVAMRKRRIAGSRSAVWRFFQRHKISVKKSLRAAEQERADVARARRHWMRTCLTQPDWCLSMKPPPRPTWCGFAAAVVAGLRRRAMVAPWVLDGPMNATTFIAYLKECLVPTLKRGDIVMMDSLSVHKVAGVREVIEAAGAKLRYLPKYSPDLNPIEQAFSKLKAHLRKAAERTIPRLSRRIGAIVTAFSPQECTNYFCCRPQMTGHGQGFPRAAMNSRGERYPRALCG